MPTDPRIGDAGGVNGDLQDAVIRHAIARLGLEESEASRLRAFLAAELDPRVLAALRDALGRVDLSDAGGVVRSDRTLAVLNDLVAVLRAETKEVFELALRESRGRLREIVEMEIDFAAADVLGARVPLTFDVRRPAPGVVTDIVSRRDIEGRNLREWFRDLSEDTVRRVDRQVRIALANGENTQEVVNRIRGNPRRPGGPGGVLEFTKHQADMIARTAVANASNAANEAVYIENDDVVAKVKVVATLDLRTCPICAALDGRTFPLAEGPRAPFHPFCRCVVSPVTLSLEEMGVRIRRQNRNVDAGTRASMNGLVPKSTKFPEWIKTQGYDDLVEVFGRTRANWIRDGLIDPRELIDKQLRIRRLEELRPLVGRRREG